jgi:hypothetical protein
LHGRKEGTPFDAIDRQVVDLLRKDRNFDTIQGIRKFLPEYKIKYQEANPDLEKLYPSDENLIIDSARKRIIKLLEKTL